MLRILSIFIFITIAASVGYFLKDYDFYLSGNVLGYYVKISFAFLAVCFLFFLILFYSLLRFLWWVRTSPSRLAAKLHRDKEQKGYKEIMLGFSALAEGDYAKASKLGNQAAKHLPKQPLATFLQAQSASLGGNKTEAIEYYRQLSETEEGKFVGYRGIIANAIENKQPHEAMRTAEELLKTSPKSKWLNEAIIDLAFRSGDWEKAEKFIRKAEANKAIPKQELAARFAVFYFIRAKNARTEKRFEDARWLAEKSMKYKPDFLPAALIYSSLLISAGEFKKVRSHIEDIWKTSPHPALAADYERAIQEYKPEKRLKLIEDLFDKNPSDYVSVLFYAKALAANGQAAEAKDMLVKAASYRETRSLCALMAQIDDSKAWNARKDVAEDDKCWYCSKTGARYLEWQVYSDSGEMNTIIWGFPPKISESANKATQFEIIKQV